MLAFSDTRTIDVHTSKTFDQLLIHPEVVQRIKSAGYAVPTPIQAGALPLGLMGNDLLVQAKSGTGKTLVFATLTAQIFTEVAPTGNPLAVLLAPTREIALQIKSTVNRVAPSNIRIVSCIGGTDYSDNRKTVYSGVDVLIGTPGRIAQLINDCVVKLNESRLFVLDEADKLCGETFLSDIELIYKVLCPKTQVTVFSATYTQELSKNLCDLMHTPVLIRLNADDVQLVGIHQYALIACGENPINVIHSFLSDISYGQVIIFSNSIHQCQPTADKLESEGHRVKVFSSDLPQDQRTRVINNLKNYALRVMVSTDAAARGIDASNVNVVVNIGPPYDTDTYFHRIGRAGRYGGYGVGVTILTTEGEVARFKVLTKQGKFHVKILGRNFPDDITTNTAYFKKQPDFVGLFDCPATAKASKNSILQINGDENLKQFQNTTLVTKASVPRLKTVNKEPVKAIQPNLSPAAATPNISQIVERTNSASSINNSKTASANLDKDLKIKRVKKPEASAENKLFESNLETALNGIQKIKIDSNTCSNFTESSVSPSKMSLVQGKTFGRSFTPTLSLEKVSKPVEKSTKLAITSTNSSAIEKLSTTFGPSMTSENSQEEFLAASETPPDANLVETIADSIALLKNKSFGKSFTSSTTLGKLFSSPNFVSSKLKNPSKNNEGAMSVSKTQPDVSQSTTQLSKNQPSVNPAQTKKTGGTRKKSKELLVESTSIVAKPPESTSSEKFITTEEAPVAILKNPELLLFKVTAYSRAQMYEIRDSLAPAAWEAYARSSTWNVTTDPFQFDPELRCPFSRQLKVLQKREKEYFKLKVAEMEEAKNREKANKAVVNAYAAAAMKYASGFRPSGVIDVDKVQSVLPLQSCKSWNVYVDRLAAFTAKSEAERAKIVQGPMISPEFKPEEFEKILAIIEPRLQQTTAQVLASIRGAHPDATQLSQPSPISTSDASVQTDFDSPPRNNPTVIPTREELGLESSEEELALDSENDYSIDTLDADFDADGRKHIFQAYADLLVSKIKFC